MSGYETIAIDAPAAVRPPHHPSTGGQAQCDLALMRVELLAELRRADYDPDVRSASSAAPPVLFGRLRLRSATVEGSPFYSRRVTGSGHGMRRHLVLDLGPRSPGDRPGPRIRHRRGTELASACDLVYVAADAAISYRGAVASPPDWQYHTPLLGMRRAIGAHADRRSHHGEEAALIGFANRSFAPEELEQRVRAIAGGSLSPQDLTRSTSGRSRSFDLWERGPPCAPIELQALAGHTETAKAVRGDILEAVSDPETSSVGIVGRYARHGGQLCG